MIMHSYCCVVVFWWPDHQKPRCYATVTAYWACLYVVKVYLQS